jgi:probable HAF family extracellular repeat protein
MLIQVKEAGMRRIFCGGVIAVLVAIPQLGFGQVSYSVTDLGTLGGPTSSAASINNLGQIVGTADTSNFFPGSTRPIDDAFLYTNGTIIDLGTLGGPGGSQATGINDSGQIVGDSITNDGGQSAFLYTNGVMTNLGPTLPNSISSATAINDMGQVSIVAYLYSSADDHGFLYSNGKSTDMGTSGPSNAFETWPTSINNSGQVVGRSAETGNLNGQVAMLYSDGIMTQLGVPNGAQISWAYGINDSDQIVGYASEFNQENQDSDHAVMYSNGVWTDLGSFGGTNSAAAAINDAGKIVGYSTTSSGSQHAFVYSGGQMTDLNNLIPSKSGWTLTNATAINSSGQIVGTGTNSEGQTHAFELTPTAQLKPPTISTPSQPSTDAPPIGIAPASIQNLILVTHGLNDNATSPTGWVQTMVSSIAQKIGSQQKVNPVNEGGYWIVGNTVVTSFDWSNIADVSGGAIESGLALPFLKGAAENVGRELGAALVQDGYENVSNIQFIAHSAGAAVINEAAHVLRADGPKTGGPTIQTTFLDPYAGLTHGGATQYGQYSNWSDDYYSQDWTGASTQQNLTNAFNVDVTWLDPTAQSTGQSSHDWPITFYQDTISNPSYAGGYGFPLSEEGGNWNPSAHPVGNNPAVVLGTPPNFLTPAYSDSTAPAINLGQLQSQSGLVSLSPTGTVSILGTSFTATASLSTPSSQEKLTIAAASANPAAGPAWIAALVPISGPTNTVSFEADFTSQPGAEGLLTVYWDGTEIADVDERWVLSGMQHYSFGIPGTYDNGSYTLAFRLDDFSDISSSVNVDDIQTSDITVSVPEPSLTAVCVLVIAVRLAGRRHLLAHRSRRDILAPLSA